MIYTPYSSYWLCCINHLRVGVALSRTDLSHGFRDRDAERGQVVQDSNADLELCDLMVDVPGLQALAQQLDAIHRGLGAA